MHGALIDARKSVKVGERVRFKKRLEPSDEQLVFLVVEDRGERVLVVEESDTKRAMAITPLSAYLKSDLVKVDG